MVLTCVIVQVRSHGKFIKYIMTYSKRVQTQRLSYSGEEKTMGLDMPVYIEIDQFRNLWTSSERCRPESIDRKKRFCG